MMAEISENACEGLFFLYKEVLAHLIPTPDNLTNAAECRVSWADERYDLPGAISLYEQAISRSREDIHPLWVRLSQLYIVAGKHDEAEKTLLTAIDLKPEDASLWFELGEFYLFYSYPEGFLLAETAFKKSLDCSTSPSNALLGLSELHEFGTNNLEDAEAFLKMAGDLAPEDEVNNYQNLLADFWFRNEMLDKFLQGYAELFKKASVEYDAAFVLDVLANKAEEFAIEGRYADAVKVWQTISGLAPDSKYMKWPVYVYVLIKNNEYNKAHEVFKKSLNLAKDDNVKKLLTATFTDALYDSLLMLVATSGWTYACNEEIVQKWNTMYKLAGYLIETDKNDVYARYLRGRAAGRLPSCKQDGNLVGQAIQDLEFAVLDAGEDVSETFKLMLRLELGLAYMWKYEALFGTTDTTADDLRKKAQAVFNAVISAGKNLEQNTIDKRQVIEAKLSMAWLEYYGGRYDAAEKKFSEIADDKKSPSPPVSIKERAEAYRGIALCKFRLGRRKVEMEEFSEAKGLLIEADNLFQKTRDLEDKGKKYVEQLDIPDETKTASPIEQNIVMSINKYLATSFEEERADTTMNWGFAKRYYGLAIAKLKEKGAIEQYRAAADLLKEISKRAPNNAEALRFRGACLVDTGAVIDGAELETMAIERGTKNPDNARSIIVRAAMTMLNIPDKDRTGNDPDIIKILGMFEKAEICNLDKPTQGILDLTDVVSKHPRCETFKTELDKCFKFKINPCDNRGKK